MSDLRELHEEAGHLLRALGNAMDVQATEILAIRASNLAAQVAETQFHSDRADLQAMAEFLRLRSNLLAIVRGIEQFATERAARLLGIGATS